MCLDKITVFVQINVSRQRAAHNKLCALRTLLLENRPTVNERRFGTILTPLRSLRTLSLRVLHGSRTRSLPRNPDGARVVGVFIQTIQSVAHCRLLMNRPLLGRDTLFGARPAACDRIKRRQNRFYSKSLFEIVNEPSFSYEYFAKYESQCFAKTTE